MNWFIEKVDDKTVKTIIAALLFVASCASSPSKIVWEPDINVALQRAGHDRLVLMYFYDDSCEYCAMMNKSFADDDVKEVLSDRFIVVPIKADSQLGRDVGIKIVPTLVSIVPTSDGGQPIGSFVGYLNPQGLRSFALSTHDKATAHKTKR